METYIYKGNITNGNSTEQPERFGNFEINSTFPGFKYVSYPGFRVNFNHQFSSTTSSGNSKQKEKTLRQRFCEFGADSTVHGVKYVTNPKFNLFRR